MSETNGRYEGQWEDMMALLRDIDKRTESQENEGKQVHATLEKIEQHTGAVATYFQDQNKALLKERGIPLAIFTLFLLLVGAYVLVDKLEESDLRLKFNLTDGFEITRGAHQP